MLCEDEDFSWMGGGSGVGDGIIKGRNAEPYLTLSPSCSSTTLHSGSNRIKYSWTWTMNRVPCICNSDTDSHCPIENADPQTPHCGSPSGKYWGTLRYALRRVPCIHWDTNSHGLMKQGAKEAFLNMLEQVRRGLMQNSIEPCPGTLEPFFPPSLEGKVRTNQSHLLNPLSALQGIQSTLFHFSAPYTLYNKCRWAWQEYYLCSTMWANAP